MLEISFPERAECRPERSAANRLAEAKPFLSLTRMCLLFSRSAVSGPVSAVRLVWLVLACVAVFPACEKKTAQTPVTAVDAAQRFTVKGMLRAINYAEHEVTIEHEEIPGYMPAMTMPFAVKDMAAVQPLSAGDALKFEFIVMKEDSWIAGIQKIDPAQVRLPGSKPGTPGAAKERLKEGDKLPTFQLTDDQGRPIDRDTFRGKPLLLTFIFTRCPVPNYCPRMSANFSALAKATEADAKLRDAKFLSVTIDPEHDTPQILSQYSLSYRGGSSDRWRFATGTREQVSRITEDFSVQVKPEDGTITHGLATALVDAQGVIRKIWRGNGWTVEEVVAELGKL
jgi:protein SCO1